MGTFIAPIALTFGALAIRGLAPLASWGGASSAMVFVVLALLSCLRPAWRFRREGPGNLLRDPAVFLLLAQFPLFASSYFWLGASHGVDAINHIEYVRSMVFDHDLDIRNDDAILGGAIGENPEPDPTQINMHGIGPAFLWAPLYLTAHSLCGVIGQACNGSARPYLAACTLTSMFFSVLGLICAYRLALRFASRGAALLAVMGIAWGTFLFWYLTAEPTMSHNLSFATASLTFLLIQRRPQGARQWFLVGLSVGFSATVRFANALLGAAALPSLFAPYTRSHPREIARNAAALMFGAAVAFSPQIYAWERIFGAPVLIPNGPGFLDHSPALLGVLFSPRGGLLTWSPLLYLAIPGLLAFRRLGWRTAVSFWAVILLLYVTNARVPDWWGGSSFGNRRFCTILGPVAVGLAMTFDVVTRFSRRRPLFAPALLVVLASMWNLLLAEGRREFAWGWDQPVGFPQMARVATDEVSRAVGSPFSLPGALIEWARTGRPLSDLDASIFRRPYSVFILRFGDGDIPFLRGGFSVPRGTGEDLHRATRDGRLVVPLHRAVDYWIGIRARGVPGQAVRLEINGLEVEPCPLSRATAECEREVPEGAMRAGDNEIRLRAEAGPGQAVEEVDFLSFWLKPREPR
ncbi:MAG: hypothetical protein JJE39_14370 [Vicinamibacteria bacterium]|nr:hypothetical protein [Vicinamibacteria bacterium]